MFEGFLTEMIIRRTTSWFEERHPLGPSVTGIHPFPLLGGNWFVHLSLSHNRPHTHALVRMRGASIESFEVVQADGVICPTCRAST
jgi:hypothetical protein